jgi:hypothetical protein
MTDSPAYRRALAAFQRCSNLQTAEFVARNRLDDITNRQQPEARRHAAEAMAAVSISTCTPEELEQLRRLSGYHLEIYERA